MEEEIVITGAEEVIEINEESSDAEILVKEASDENASEEAEEINLD